MARHPTYGEAILWLIMTIENAWVDVFDRARATANCLVVRTRRRIAVLPAAAAYRASGLDATRGPGIADKQQGMGISIT